MRDWTISDDRQFYWEGAPRRYLGASPSHGSQSAHPCRITGCLGGVHWPTDEEYEAIHAAAQIGEQKKRRIPWSVEVKVRNSQFVARVTCEREHGYRTQIVRRSNPDSAGCLNEKSWIGIPVWADQGAPRRTSHTYQDTGLFHGPGDCCDGCREQVDAHHRTIFHHHRHGARHLHHNEDAPPSSAIERLFAGFGLVKRVTP